VNPNQSSTQDFFFEDNEIDHFELFDREDNSQDIDDEVTLLQGNAKVGTIYSNSVLNLCIYLHGHF